MSDVIDANSQFFYSNVKSVTTDFNISPYYDDYDGKNNYYKILFKPGYAVQARELTQVQSILQEQVNRFGQHIFKEGSMVVGGKFNIDTRVNFVKVKDVDTLDNNVNIQDFKDQIVTGQTTGIQAYVNLVLDGSEGTDKPKTLYVTYISSNPDTDQTVFTENEPLICNVGTLIVGNSTPVGFGSVFTLNEGVRFAKEHFIYHTKQSVVIDRYDIYPTCKVGLYLEESIVNSSQDSSLLDPALESSNFAAPGADRFKITPILTRLDIDDVAGFPDYVNLFVINEGKVTEISERPTYNVIQDELAKRTSDESGDYYVRGFNTVIEEHLNVIGNGGYKTEQEGGDSQLLSVQIEPGTAYVKGYEINKRATEFMELEKSTSFSNVNSQILSTKIGSYIVANEVSGSWNLNSGQQIDLYDTAQRRISRGVSSTVSQTGNKIGTARVKSISRDSGSLGSPNGSIRIHLFDFNMLGSNSFSSVKSVYYDNSTTADIGADVVLTNGSSKLVDPYASLLYYTGSDYTKTIRSPDGTVDTSFFFKKTTDVSIVSAGTFSITSSIVNEIFPYGTTTLSSSDVTDIFLNINQSVNIAIPGTALSGAGTTTLTGASSQFSRLNVGDKIEISGNGKSYIIGSIVSDSVLTVTENLPLRLSGNTFFKAYKSGDMIDLSGKGVDAGSTRTVTATPTSLSFALNETFGTTISGTVTYTMVRTNAREVRKVLKRNRYVLIDCATNIGANTGPYSLGISDVYAINSIRKASSFTTVTDGVDVTSDFVIDGGQRDNSYTNARIVPFSVLTPSDKLLVNLDYFDHDFTLGVGYFSIDSYPIDDTSPASDQITTPGIPIYSSPGSSSSFDLRNYLDFRPVYTNTAADATSLTGITTNPIASTTLKFESSGLRLPADSEFVTYDYSYYLARRDIVTLNKSGEFMIIKGVPSESPVTPATPSHLMSLAALYISPYPSLSPNFARLLDRAPLACSSTRKAQIRFTMKDIGVLKQRIDNLETYVSLTLLEKNALDLKILDENGLDRFKNGIFVDSFNSFNLSDTGNPDHRICYDPKEASIRPLYETEAVGYDYYSGSNVIIKNNMLMLPYSEVVAIRQPFATTTRNVETTVYRFIGKMYLDPDSDYWVNTNRLNSQTFRFGATDADVTPYSVVYGSYQTVVTGVSESTPVLTSSASSTTITGSSGTGQSTSTSYIINTAQNKSSGATSGAAAGSRTVNGQTLTYSSIDSLIALYGASTPVTFSGQSTSGQFIQKGVNVAAAVGATVSLTPAEQALLNPLSEKYSAVKTLGDIKTNAAALAELDDIMITINTGGVSTSGVTTTTNTYQSSVSTGTQASRSYTETFQTLKTDTQSLGDKVTTVAPIADIRPQTIAFEARGVKSTTRHYVYFDGQLMSSYVTPGTMATVTYQNANTNADLITATGREGSALYSNDKGVVYGFLRLPSDASRSFRTGTKEVIVTDSPTNEPDATSFAKAYFAAQGITQTVQETIITTGTVVTETKSGVLKEPVVYSNTKNTYTVTTNTSFSFNNVKTTAVVTDIVSCMAYSFKLNTPNGEEGTFLSSVDVFFSEKDPNLGVWFEIRAMDNSGNITKVQVPDSEVWLTSSEVNVSDNGSVATNIEFKAPIFLLNNEEYAFVIHTVGINPNYYMYVCVLGQEDILTKKMVNDRPLTGTLFTTNNNTDWDIVPRVDLKCTFYRAKFQTGVVGEAILGNEHTEYVELPLTPRTGANTSWFGDRILGNDQLNLSTPSVGTISVGDYIIGTNTGANAVVSSVVGSVYTMTNHNSINLRFDTSESVTIRRANGLSTPITSSVVSKFTAEGIIKHVKPRNDRYMFNGNSALMIIKNTNGLFRSNDVLSLLLSGNTVNTKI